ncbi:MAG: polysaccharide biosynthesis protein [Aeromicrobium sp.]
MKSAQTTVAGGTLVAAGMMTMNVTVYAFNVLAARLLVPREFGALTALFGIILVGSVASLGLQAVTARRLAVAPEARGDIIVTTVRVTALVASVVGLAVAGTTVALTPALRLDSYWPVVLCGATLVPMTIMGAQAGVAQGTSRWGALTAIYVGNGLGRLLGGTIALVIDPTPTSAMIGIAIGAWTPAVAGAPMFLGHRGSSGPGPSRRDMLREAVLSTHALLAFFVLSNMDSLIARNLFDGDDSGLYASGLILAKAAFFLPQFVSVVLFPDLARATTHHARLRAISFVGLLGVLTVAGTVVLPQLALILVGGDDYAAARSRLWLFALAGSLLAIVYLLVFDALAQHAHGIVVMLWGAVAAVLASAYGLGVGITGLVLSIIVVTATLAVLVEVTPVLARRASERR